MRLKQAMDLQLLAESAVAPTTRHHAVMSPHMRKSSGHIRPSVKREKVGHSAGGHGAKGIRKSGVKHAHPKTLPVKHAHIHLLHSPPLNADRADASTADSSDVKMLHWKTKRVFERIRKRNLDPYEALKAAKETGPCGCTLELGERVLVEGIGKGRILSRKERMLTVALDNGQNRTIDQTFVHRPASARR